MITISLCMIVKNEEDTLPRCLESIKDIADEIIIADTGSKDKTKEEAYKYTDKVYDFKWINDFSAARNFAFSKATMDYILWLDADDIIRKKDKQKFIDLKKNFDTSVDIVMMKYNTGFDEKGNVTFSYYRERLSRRSGNYQWYEPIHEYLGISGKIIHSDIAITHDKIHPSEPGRNIKIYESIIEKGKELSPRGMYYFARELKDNGKFKKSIEYFKKFLDSGKGWVEDNIGACNCLAQCYTYCKMEEEILPALFRSFQYDLPRGEICCAIGSYFKDKKDYVKAVFWYEMIVEKLKKPENSWGFIMHDYWDYIPSMELCVCYYSLGNMEKAFEYHKKAQIIKPESPQVLYNEKFFKEHHSKK